MKGAGITFDVQARPICIGDSSGQIRTVYPHPLTGPEAIATEPPGRLLARSRPSQIAAHAPLESLPRLIRPQGLVIAVMKGTFAIDQNDAIVARGGLVIESDALLP